MENRNTLQSTVIKATSKSVPEPENRYKYQSDLLNLNDLVIKTNVKQKRIFLIRNASLLNESSIKASIKTSATAQDNNTCTIKENKSVKYAILPQNKYQMHLKMVDNQRQGKKERRALPVEVILVLM